MICNLNFYGLKERYPKSEAKRKIADSNQLKIMKEKSQISFKTYLEKLDDELVAKVNRLLTKY